MRLEVLSPLLFSVRLPLWWTNFPCVWMNSWRLYTTNLAHLVITNFIMRFFFVFFKKRPFVRFTALQMSIVFFHHPFYPGEACSDVDIGTSISFFLKIWSVILVRVFQVQKLLSGGVSCPANLLLFLCFYVIQSLIYVHGFFVSACYSCYYFTGFAT